MNSFEDARPTGPCLDTLLNSGEVPMSGEVYSLVDLFGMDRHNLPKSLPCTRRGRRKFYNFGAVIRCMDILLESKRWLLDPSVRNRVITGTVGRARDFGPGPDVAAALQKFFTPYLQ
jgi:hypothetical protein